MHTGLEKRPRQIDGAGKLIGLHPDQADQRAAAIALDHVDDLLRPHPAVGFVIGVDTEIDVVTEHLATANVLGKTVEAGQRIRGDR
jgi:hypothetical protein